MRRDVLATFRCQLEFLVAHDEKLLSPPAAARDAPRQQNSSHAMARDAMVLTTKLSSHLEDLPVPEHRPTMALS